MTAKANVRTDWAQSTSSLYLSLYCKGEKRSCQVSFPSPTSICVSFVLVDSNEEQFSFEEHNLGGELDGANHSVKVSPMKVEVVVPKKIEGNWREIVVAQRPFPPSYPTSSRIKTDWNKLDKECELENEQETKEGGGDSALNAMFREIYAKGSDETRRAMNKSFQTSCGTVLSTNWEDVQNKEYECEIQAPGGQTVKKWEN